MKEIAKSFINGSSAEKLAIISNFSTILGVSVATFVAGPFLNKFTDLEFIITDFLIAISFYFIYFLISSNIIYSSIIKLLEKIKENNYSSISIIIVYILFISWVLIVLFPYVKYFTGNTFNVSYFLSPKANISFSKVINFKKEELKKGIVLSGKAIFNKRINPFDYVVILYVKDNSGYYKYLESTYPNEKEIELNSEGKFSISIAKEYNNGNKALVIYRKSDWSLFTHYKYPNNFVLLQNKGIDELGAYTQKLEI